MFSLINSTYAFNLIDNIIQLDAQDYTYTYAYDKLSRLISSEGSGTLGSTNQMRDYNLVMSYGVMGDILHKNQQVDHNDVNDVDFSYIYPSQTKIENGGLPHAPKQIGEENYTYDASGNVTRVIGGNTDRTLTWDEENRLMQLEDPHNSSSYRYNHAGERVIKRETAGAIESTGGALQGSASSQEGEYTAYINPYFVQTQTKGFSKYYYAGSKRLVGKIGVGRFDNYYNGTQQSAGGIDYAARYAELQQEASAPTPVSAPVGWPSVEEAPTSDATSGALPSVSSIRNTGSEATQEPNFGFGYNNEPDPNEPQEDTELLYFFHSDHLGSTSIITDKKGAQQQFVAYLPFGETMYEEGSTDDLQSYLFNGKELDDDTGLYYYGARYYNPKISLWYGVDPLAAKYPSISPFAYCMNNPVMYVDPDGMQSETAGFQPSNQMKRFMQASEHAGRAVAAGQNAVSAKVSIEVSYGTIGAGVKLGGVVNAKVEAGVVEAGASVGTDGVTVEAKGGFVEGEMKVGTGNSSASATVELGVGKGAVNINSSDGVSASGDLGFAEAGFKVGGDQNVNVKESGEFGISAKVSMVKMSVSANFKEMGTAISEGIQALGSLGVFDALQPQTQQRREDEQY